jgi:hypothetical protein
VTLDGNCYSASEIAPSSQFLESSVLRPAY